MAAARDQAARIVRTPEPDAARRRSRARRRRSWRTSFASHVAEEAGASRQHAGAPATDKPARRRPMPPTAAAPKSGKRKFVMMGVVALLALAAVSYGVYYTFWSDASTSPPTTPMCAPTTPCSARGSSGHIAAILPGDNSIVRAGDVIFKIDDGDYRIAVDAARTQDRDPAGHHRPHRPPGRGDGKRGRAGQGATRLRGSGAEARRSRFRPPAGAEHQGICLARHLRSFRSRPRPGCRRGEIGAGGL